MSDATLPPSSCDPFLMPRFRGAGSYWSNPPPLARPFSSVGGWKPPLLGLRRFLGKSKCHWTLPAFSCDPFLMPRFRGAGSCSLNPPSLARPFSSVGGWKPPLLGLRRFLGKSRCHWTLPPFSCDPFLMPRFRGAGSCSLNPPSLARPFLSVGGWKPPLLGLRRFLGKSNSTTARQNIRNKQLRMSVGTIAPRLSDAFAFHV